MEIHKQILLVLMSALAFMGLFCILMLIRNEMVYKYRISLIHKIAEMGDKDIRAGKDPRWRWEYFHRVDYDTMVYKFWKPLDSFYKNKAFIKP